MDGRKLGPSDVLGRTHYLFFIYLPAILPGKLTENKFSFAATTWGWRLEAEQLPYQAVMQPALDGAAVDPYEDLRTHAKYFQSPEGE